MSFTPEDSIRARGLCIEIPEVSFDRTAAMIELHQIAETRARNDADGLRRQLAGETEARSAERKLRQRAERIADRWKWTAIVSMILSAALIVGMVIR
jgi:hypothetical protein